MGFQKPSRPCIVLLVLLSIGIALIDCSETSCPTCRKCECTDGRNQDTTEADSTGEDSNTVTLPPNAGSLTYVTQIFSINPLIQTCNPSISQDTVQFKGCMLWLNFDGQLNVNVESNISGYATSGIAQHDRITVTDTNNSVVWYIKNSEFGFSPNSHIQDPEWSTHPDYLVCLMDTDDKSLENMYSVFSVHVPTRTVFRLCDSDVGVVATPHVWIEQGHPTSVPDSMTYSDSLERFAHPVCIENCFGTRNVKIVYHSGPMESQIKCVDYTTTPPSVFSLKKPEGRETWWVESPLVSPDGDCVAYSCAQRLNGTEYEAYVQHLSPGSEPMLVSSIGSAPHWWVNPSTGSTYIVYTTIQGNYLVTTLPSFETRENGTAGYTLRVPVELGSGGNAVIQSQQTDTLARYPFKGGLSPDGKYLATGYQYTYMASLGSSPKKLQQLAH